MDRFFCPDLTTGPGLHLDESEAHHLAHVLRYQVGDEVQVFDGRGRSAPARVTSVKKRDVLLEPAGPIEVDPPSRLRIVLGVAAPKGDRLRWLVEKATEIGVDTLIPLICERSVVEPGETRRAKLEQTVIAACKQCGRNSLMMIGEPQRLSEFLSGAASARLIADVAGTPIRRWKDDLQTSRLDEIRCAIGPEGGFTPAELQEARRQDVVAVSLAPAILRVETAAIVLASYLFCEMQGSH
jgi:16S rRNA (uracil1498-N3)-methyltransferase